MTRRRYSRRRRPRIRLWPVERLLVILGGTLYVVGLFGGMGFLPMPPASALFLLGVSGALLLLALFSLIFYR